MSITRGLTTISPRMSPSTPRGPACPGRACQRLVTLPCYPGLAQADQNRVIEAIREHHTQAVGAQI